MSLSLRSAIAVAATIASLAAIASDTTRLQTLQVTAPVESNKTGEVVEEEHSGSSTRISREQLTFYGKQLGVLLSQEAGIQQRQSGGFGSFSSATFRGAGSEHTAVYLDGILLNSGAEPVIDLSTLELLNIESIDLYRGTSPMQLGHGSIGGAVNLRSLQIKDSTTSAVRLGVGALGRRELLFNYQGGRQQWDWLAGASTSRSDNDFHFVSDNRTPLNPNDDTRQKRNNNQAQRSALLLKAGYQATPLLRTDVLLQAAERALGVPGLTNAQENQALYDTNNSQLHLSQTVNDISGWNTRHTLYQHTGSSHYDDRLGQVGLGAQDIESDTRTLGAKTYWETFTASGTLGLSMDYRHESLDSSDRLSSTNDVSADRRQLLTTAHLAWFDSSERWMLAPAIRWLNIDDRTDNSANSQQKPRSSHSQFSPQLGLSWSPGETLSFSANAGGYFREPSFGERFGSLGLINGNPLLEPEEGRNYDLGFRYENANVTLSLSAFLAQRNQLIALSCDARRVCRTLNIGKSRVTGIEISSQWRISAALNLTANATFQNPVNLNRNASYRKKLPAEARQTGYFRLQYKPSAIAYWYDVQVNRDRFYDSPNILPAVDTAVHTVGLNSEIGNWRIDAQLHNLGNENVEDFRGLPKPGRVWHIAVSRTW